MTVTTPSPPPLPDEVAAMRRRLRLRYVRKAATEVLATAASQRWTPAEILGVLLAEEAAGRDRTTIALPRCQSRLPAAKTFDAWHQAASAIPEPVQQALRTLEWTSRAEDLVISGRSGTAGATSPRHSGTSPSTRARRSPGTRLLHYAHVPLTDGIDSYRLAQATARKGAGRRPRGAGRRRPRRGGPRERGGSRRWRSPCAMSAAYGPRVKVQFGMGREGPVARRAAGAAARRGAARRAGPCSRLRRPAIGSMPAARSRCPRLEGAARGDLRATSSGRSRGSAELRDGSSAGSRH